MEKRVNDFSRKVQGLFVTSQTKRLFRKPAGQVPGTAIFTGAKHLEEVLMTVHDFDENHYDQIPLKIVEKSEPYLEDPSKTWIQVRGLHNIDILKSVWDYFGLHPLIQEDIVSVSQRPKIEHYPDHLFVVMRMITTTSGKDQRLSTLHSEQISIILGKNYVLSFQETDEPVFEPVLNRLEMTTTRLRKLGPDYLAYALMDTVVDHYFSALDLIAEEIEKVEERIINEPKEEHLQQIHALRRDLIYLRKSVWSLRDGINSLIRDDSKLISEEVKVYFRDVYDHVVQVIDSIETSREMVFGLFDMYMSGLSNKMNEVMKVLTIIATIFIPLTFIAGIYGMNFNPDISPFNMPELNWYYGYPFSLILMVILTGSMLIYFKRKGWL
jgi:magnesium transporter